MTQKQHSFPGHNYSDPVLILDFVNGMTLALSPSKSFVVVVARILYSCTSVAPLTRKMTSLQKKVLKKKKKRKIKRRPPRKCCLEVRQSQTLELTWCLWATIISNSCSVIRSLTLNEMV